MSESWAATCRLVRERAADRCELCRMHAGLQGAEFHIDHVLPSSKGGGDEADNLQVACPSCNLSKSDRTELTDPESGAVVPLFNPRTQPWTDHFRFDDGLLVGRTPIGRALVAALDLNSARRMRIRTAERPFGYFPPASANREEPDKSG